LQILLRDGHCRAYSYVSFSGFPCDYIEVLQTFSAAVNKTIVLHVLFIKLVDLDTLT